jgi:hypothetical protein
MSAEVLVEFSHRVLGLESAEAPAGYHDLPLCVIDAVFSVGMTYTATRNVVLSFIAWAQRQGTPLADEGLRAGHDRPECSVSEVLALLASRSDEELTTVIFSNSNRTSSKSGILKARASVQALDVLRDREIDVGRQLLGAVHDAELKIAWRQVRGQGSGISWRYLLMNAGHEGVKPDRMIVRFVSEGLERDVSPAEAEDLMIAAHELLQREHPSLTLRTFDHAAWKYARNR